MEEADIHPGMIPKEVTCAHAYTCVIMSLQCVLICITKTLTDLTL